MLSYTDLGSFFPEHPLTRQLSQYTQLLSGLFEQAFVLLLVRYQQQNYVLASDEQHARWVHWALGQLPELADDATHNLPFFLPGYHCCLRRQPLTAQDSLSLVLIRHTRHPLTAEQEQALLALSDAIGQLLQGEVLAQLRQVSLYKTSWPFAHSTLLQGQAILNWSHGHLQLQQCVGVFAHAGEAMLADNGIVQWLLAQQDSSADAISSLRLGQLPQVCALNVWRIAPEQAFLSLQDVSAERELRLLQVRERQLQGLFDSGIAGMIGLNDHSQLVFANDIARQLLWLPDRETGAERFNLFHIGIYLLDEADDRRLEPGALLTELTSQPVLRCRLMFPDGSHKIVEFRGSLRQQIDNPDVVAYCMLLDVSEQYQLHQALSVIRQHIDNLLSFSPVVLYQAGDHPGHGFLYISPNAHGILGYPASQILGEPDFFLSHVHPDDREQLVQEWQHDNSEYRFWSEAAQAYIWLKDLRRVDQDDEHCVYGALTNTSARKEAELEQQRLSRALMRQQKQLAETLQALTEGVMTLDQQGVIQTVNPAVCQLFGYSEPQLLGQSAEMLMPLAKPEQPHDVARYLQTEAHHLISKGRRIMAQHQSGHQFPLRISIAELPVAESGQRSFVGCLHDLTQAEQQQEQLVQASKLSAIGTLTSGVAHDFNNILGIVRGYAELLSGQTDEKVQKTAQNLIKAADRGSALTKSLLDFSSNRSRETVHTELGQLLTELSPMLREACSKERQIQLVLQPATDPTWVNVEKGGLEDVLLNMVINAVHACQANTGKNGVITVAFAQQQVSSSSHFIEPVAAGSYACLSISDTGCGMTEQVQRKIFEPFFTTKGAKGTGLGLAQVFGFIRRCQGGIVVHSQLGIGTRFELYLPLLPAQSVPVSQHVAPVPVVSVATPASVCPADADSEILLVDDDAELLEVHGAILEMAGFKVHSCNSPAEALTQLKQKQFRLMVSDIVMPAMNGFELSLAARALHSGLKIQLVSAYADDSLIKDAVSQQLYSERLQKPVRASQLVKRVKELLGESAG